MKPIIYSVEHDPGTQDDTTFGEQCPWPPHHNQCPDVRGTLHENLFGIKDKERKTLGDSSLKRKETGIKDCYKRTQIKDQKRTKGYLDTFGVKCHLGVKPGQSRLLTPLVEEMIETKEPEDIDSQTRRISVLDSEEITEMIYLPL